MKKLAALLVLALTSAALTACGSDEGTTTTTTNPTGSAATGQAEGKKAGSSEKPGGQAGGEKAAGGAAAAGGEKTGGEKAGGSGESTLKFEADPGSALAYTATSASTTAGDVEVEFVNPQSLTHDVAIEDSAGEEVGKTDLIADDSATTSVELQPGAYTFYCSVPGHREAGMEGTLTVK